MDTRRRAAVMALVLTVPLVACSPGEPEAVSTPSSPVIVPGRPGEAAKTISPEEFEAMPHDDEHTDADVDFMTMMIDHHAQAVTMTSLVPERSATTAVQKIAARMSAVQDGEIRYMGTWLKENGLPLPAAARARMSDDEASAPPSGSGPRQQGGHDHGTMPGMLTAAELKALEDADGVEFDRLFLESMIKHHRGALVMCDDAMVGGKDLRVQELASGVAADQAAEISRMEQILADL